MQLLCFGFVQRRVLDILRSLHTCSLGFLRSQSLDRGLINKRCIMFAPKSDQLVFGTLT